MWWISRPLTRRGARLTAEQTLFLRKISRKTWAFFETFVGPEDHWLPPDNYQEYRVATVAHRTSPTNMGLALLANLSAYDFGYISAGQLIERTENALRTMEAMERHRGHFYNWYDTQSLKPQLPMYISTVDSGNLAAHLLTLRPGLLALPDQKILSPQVFIGLRDTVLILTDAIKAEKSTSPPLTQPSLLRGEGTQKPSRPAGLAQLQNDMESAYDSPPTTLAAARHCLDHLAASAAEVAVSLEALGAAPDNEAVWWARAFVGQCRAALDDLAFLASPVASNTDEIPTLREMAGLGNQRASARIASIDHLVAQLSYLTAWSMISCSTRRVICWLSGTTLGSAGGTRVL